MPKAKSVRSKKSRKSTGNALGVPGPRKVNAYIQWVNSPQGRAALLRKKPELKNDVPRLGKELGRLWRQKSGKSVTGGKRRVKKSKTRKIKSRR